MNIKPIMLTLIMMAASVYSKAQSSEDNKTQRVKNNTTKNSMEKEYGDNIVKINVSAFVLKGFGIQYERKVGKRTTVALGFSAIPTSTVAFKNFYDKQIDNARVNIEDFKIGTTIFTPELKYYFGSKGAFHGFYMAPYVRISHYNIEGPVKYNSSTNVERTAFFSGSINSISGGILLGSNFKIGKKLYLDWWIIGGSLGKASGNVNAKTPLNQDEQNGLKDALNNTDIPLTNIESVVDANGATVTSKGSVVGLRGLGLNFGIRF